MLICLTLSSSHKLNIFVIFGALTVVNVKLTESVNNNANQVKVLTEKLNKAYHDSEQTEKALNEQLANCKKQLSESAKLVNAYKAKTAAVLNHYIESKAKMLGVRANDIISKLNENYTLVDIDKK